jgi:phosphohistidine phosphatase
MRLYVIRHALAEDAVPDQPDADRELTKDGRRKLKGVVKGLRELEITFDRLLTSPWRRAAQTTELLAPLSATTPYATDLLCQPPRAELLATIAERNETTALVGHEPWLGELIAWLAFGDTRHGEAIVIKKAGVVVLDGSAVPGGMQLHALLTPRVVRAAR